ncbi:MAG: GFA family protein [Stagnimonas sp.]|nr:GFA family protein [Stagnimonas sp.]
MINGTCLCGAVHIEIEEPLEHAPEACHCTLCRKHTGNFFVGVNVRRTALRISGQENVTWYQSSEKVQRGFCAVCGSTLFWKPTIPGYQWTSIALGCLDTPLHQKVAKHTFVAEKGCYYEIDDGAPQSPAF